MKATRRLEIEVPEELAAWVDGQVAAGRFADVSEAVASALMLMQEQDEDVADDPGTETWLRDVVVPRYRAWKASGEPGLTIEEVEASLARRRAERQRAHAAE